MTAKKPRGGSVKCSCIACGKEFGVVPAQHALGVGKYCSIECRYEDIGFKRQVKAVMPGTIRQLDEACFVEIASIRKIIGRMMLAGECHASGMVAEHDRTGKGRSRYELVLTLGPAPDPRVPRVMRNALTFYYKKLVLDAMPATHKVISTRTGLTSSTVSRLLKALHKEQKCHIFGWKKATRGRHLAKYKAGPGVDAPDNLTPMTVSEINKRYKAKLIRTGRITELRARWNAGAMAKKKRSAGDQLVNALFGKPTERNNREAA